MHDTNIRRWNRFSANEPGREASRPVRILIVDSDIDSADSAQLMLNASGYSETRVAYDGESARLIAVDFQPDVVLLDLGLLGMSGYELAQSLREQAQSRDLRLIAVTSNTEHPAREEARMAGFERYLVKPVTSLDLAGLLDPPPGVNGECVSHE